ncbi:MAG: glycosyltransferase, partial [Planctomycetes bacterium]|nr:glycosyltransferase [Planctomycetota bacterium]
MPDDKLRILILSPIPPYPPHGGWQTVIYNDAKFLARRGHEIKLLSIAYDPQADSADMADIGEAEYFVIKRRPQWRQVLSNLGHPLPYTVERHIDDRLLARAVELVRSGYPDVVLIEDVVMGWYAARLKREASVPIFLRSHNVNTKIVERFYKMQRNPVLRFLGRRQWSKFDRYERSVWETSDGVSQISPVDAALAREMNPRVEQ